MHSINLCFINYYNYMPLSVPMVFDELNYFPFPGESKNKHGKVTCWSVLLAGKVLYVRCCSLPLSNIWVSNGFTIFFSLNSVCKGIKLYLHEVPDYDIAVCNPLWFTMSNLHRYFEIKSITGLMFEIITFTCISFWLSLYIVMWHLLGHAIKLVTCFHLQFWHSTRPMTSFCIFIAYINTEEFFSTSKLQDEIKTEKFELNKFHASKKDPFY